MAKATARPRSGEEVTMKRNSIVIASVFSILLSAGIAPAANIVIVNGDVAGEGLNDPTVVAPVGNNPGATLGEQRMNVLVGVGDIWGAIIESSVDIRILATATNFST